MGKIFAHSATQNGRDAPFQIDYDKIIWSGLSRAAGEIDSPRLSPGKPLTGRFHPTEKDPILLDGAVYLVQY
jgi:hypothetical protein